MAGKIDQTLKVLIEIRNELKAHRTLLKGQGERLVALEKRQVASEIRLATELVGVARAVTEVRDLLRDRLDDRDRIDQLDSRVARLERRVGASDQS